MVPAVGIALCKWPWPGRPRSAAPAVAIAAQVNDGDASSAVKRRTRRAWGGSLQNTMLPAPHIREEQLHTKTQLCPPRLCPLPASRFVQLPHPQTPSTPRQLRPGGRKRGAHLPEAPGVGSRAPLAPPAAIDSVRSRRGVTAHFAGQLGFTIACSRGNPIQNNRLFFGEQTSVF